MAKSKSGIEYKVIKLRRVILGFPKLAKPAVPVGYEDSEAKFSTDFILDPSNPEHRASIKEIQVEDKRIRKEARATRAKKQEYLVKGNTKVNANDDIYEGYEGMIALNAKNKNLPVCRYRNSKEPMTEQEREQYLYGGAIVNATINLYIQNDGKNTRCSLRAVQWVEEGTHFGGSDVTDDEFEELDDGDIDIGGDDDDLDLDGDDEKGDDLDDDIAF